jgi:hypothetical protein
MKLKFMVKPFQSGQSWMGMIGYCQKWDEHSEFAMLMKGMTEHDLKKGKRHLAVYRSDYTKDRFIIDPKNVLKATFAFWTANIKPVYTSFIDVLTLMLQTGIATIIHIFCMFINIFSIFLGEYVFSGLILTSTAMDPVRTEAAWRAIVKPSEVDHKSISKILFNKADEEFNEPMATSR